MKKYGADCLKNNQNLRRIFIGYDPVEAVVYHTCVESLIKTSTQPLTITPLHLGNLSSYVETHDDGSNSFIYSRFLVPYLANYQGWCLFIDGDMILNEDVNELFALSNESKAVLVVKHDYKTRMAKKYLGAPNEDYPRKNWSSVILWNCGHPKNKCLSPEFVAQSTGKFLHRFTWLDDSDIGSLPIEWNWLPDEFGANKKAKLLHYTLGAPCFNDFKNTESSELWWAEYESAAYPMIPGTESNL